MQVGIMYGRQNVWWAKCMVGKIYRGQKEKSVVGIMYGGQNVVALRNAYLSGQITKIE